LKLKDHQDQKVCVCVFFF